MQAYQISIEEYLQTVKRDETPSPAYDPCDHCNRGWCYGCPHQDE